ncbi:MAG: NAD(P)/FAD-dependent oxidoreductase [Kiritimatiellae bacterium]|jgi:mercuric reductase|nr:NAD(P)/FAD-dependent oxidoreductase [Kiritimatiellia bacterium]
MPSKHLIIIGGGSAATTAARAMHARGGRSTLVHEGLPLGGCCLHVGCVPSKYLIRAAERVHHAHHSPFKGQKPRGMAQNQATLFQDLRATIKEMRERNYENPLPELPGCTLIRGWGSILDATTIEVNGQRIQGDAVLLATGSRTDLADAASLPEERVLTNENLFNRDQLPESVIVIGGGYIAVELMQMMNRMGTQVTALQRSGHILSAQPAYLGEQLGSYLKAEGVHLHCGVGLTSMEAGGDGVIVHATVNGKLKQFTAQTVFMARGRLGNSEHLGLGGLGVVTTARGFVTTNSQLQTSCPTVYAAGDLLGGHMLVYTASAEAERVVAHVHGEKTTPWEPASVPWVVFSDPQVAGVGLTAEEARAEGFNVEEAELPVTRWPRFSTAKEDRGFLKLFRDPKTDALIGARALCPEAGDLVSELSLILNHRIPLRDIATSLAPYLTLTEGIQLCAAKFHH